MSWIKPLVMGLTLLIRPCTCLIHCGLRQVGLILFLILIGLLFLNGVWLGVDLKTDIKKHVHKRDWLYVHILLNVLSSIINII